MRRKNKPRPAQCSYQSLEPRHLLAGITFDAATGSITIDGTAAADVATVTTVSPLDISVELVGIDTQIFALADVTEIVFNGFQGDDQFDNGTNVNTVGFGGDGQDTLIGGGGIDQFYGGGGDDVLQGRGGDDLLNGGDGADQLDGNDGSDLLIGGQGDDEINGGNDDDTAIGGTGRDSIRGGLGDDQLFGNEDDDSIWGGGGSDILVGQAGNDTIFGEVGHDEIHGGDGVDQLIGGEGADQVTGGNGDDNIFGGAGADRLLGQSGNDWISGGELSDHIDGGDGQDRVVGGDGNDQIWGGVGDDFLNGNDGDDLINGDSGIDRIFGDAGDDLIFGGTEGDILFGGDGEDSLYGNDGDDQVFGEAEDDRLFGNLGNDFLSGGDDDDRLFGNAGDDVLFGGADDDLILGHAGRDNIRGDEGDDTVYSGSEDDLINGGDGKDRLFGQTGDDTINGDDGNDILFGNQGADILDGGLGDDDIYHTDEDQVAEDDDDTDDSDESTVGTPIGLSNRLTVSFAPNGTSIFDQTNSLFSAFSSILTDTQIRESVLDGFNLWAKNGNLDVGQVADSGDPFGTSGQSFGDSRFGDVRIGAIPLPGDVNAIAIGQGDFVAGTWAGDILFNSNANFKDAADFFAVALHEVGHVLGLKHSDDIGSVMHRYSQRSTLSAPDIIAFQGLYGQRNLDAHDDDVSNNDTLATATIVGFEALDQVSGFYPALAFGDIADSNDVDFFEIVAPVDYLGNVSFQVISDGISQLAMNVTLLTATGQVLDQATSTLSHGDIVTLTSTATASQQRFFLKIQSGQLDSAGSFSIAAKIDGRNGVPDATVLDVAKGRQFMDFEQEDIAEYFADPTNYLHNEDGHSDDEESSAVELESKRGFVESSRYEHRASLLDSADVDFFRFHSIDASIAASAMKITVRSLKFQGMMPSITVLNSVGLPVASEITVNGHGEITIQVTEFERDAEYVLAVGSDPLLPFTNGNYELVVSYSQDPLAFANFATGSLNSGSQAFHSLHIAESQIFQFALNANAMADNTQPLLWATIYDQDGTAVYQTATRAGERRTSKAVLLKPGSYTIEIEAGVGETFSGLAYNVLGVDVGGSQGPVFSDPSDSPFEKDANGDFVYPDNVVSDINFVVVDGISSNQSNPPNDAPPTDIFSWYWGLI